MWIDDDILRRCQERIAYRCWVPAEPAVVLGSSNQAVLEVNTEHCTRDGVPILKRYGGGGTVLLHSGCLVLSLGMWVAQAFQNKLYFDLLNGTVIDCLAKHWPALQGLGQNGLSDISFGPLKVGGTSLFRSRNYLLYQASVLVDCRIDLIETYLGHPTKEPDYRRQRSHRDFLVGLADLVPGLTAGDCTAAVESALLATLANRFGTEWSHPVAEQQGSLLARASGLL